MTNCGSPYLHKRFCSWCKRWVGFGDYHCPVCNHMTRGSNVRTGATRSIKISGLTGKEVVYIKTEA